MDRMSFRSSKKVEHPHRVKEYILSFIKYSITLLMTECKNTPYHS